MAMIQKKNYFLRHIIMIIVVLIILFPIIWVVSTSVRRDNAAFSSKLFSNRLTMRNYTELLFPKPTVPELIKDLNDVTAYIDEYNSYTTEQAIKRSNEDINKLFNYLDMSKENLNNVEKNYESVLSTFIEEKESILKDLNEIRETDFAYFNKKLSDLNKKLNEYGYNLETSKLDTLIKNYLSQRKKTYEFLIQYKGNNDKYYSETESLLFKVPLKTTLWKIKTYRKWKREENTDFINNIGTEVSNLESSWKKVDSEIKILSNKINTFVQEKFGITLKTISDNEEKIKNYETIQSKLKNELNNTEVSLNKIKVKVKAITDVYFLNKSKIKAAYDVIKSTEFKGGELPKTGSDGNFYLLVQKYKDILPDIYSSAKNIDSLNKNGFVETVKLYDEIFNFLYSNFSGIYSLRNNETVMPAYETLKSSAEKMAISLSEIKMIINQYKDNYENKLELISMDNKLTNEINKASNENEVLKENEKDKLDFVNEIQELPNLIFVKDFTNENIKTLNEAYYYSIFLKSKFYSKYIPERNKYFLFSAYNNLKESKNRFLSGKEKMETLISKMSVQLTFLKNNIKNIVKLNYGGNVTNIKSIEIMTDLYNTKYGNANADLSRASRIVSDFSEKLKYGNLKSILKKIDKYLYNFSMDWKKWLRKPFVRWMLNSIIVAGLTAFLTVLMTSMAAYPFSRMRFVGRKQGLLFLMIIQMFPAIMSMVALYKTLKFIGDYNPFIGLDTIGGLIFVYLGGIAYNMWLFKGYYDTIPDSLEESAMIDGATRLQTFWKIVFPLSLPIISVVTILAFMGIFNEFLLANIILQREEIYTYALGLRSFTTGPFETEWGMFTAASMIGMLPMVTLFLVMQKWIVGGLTQGSVKG
ncbi:maltose ABC transporter permease [Tepiditoga spiralis]|uniref:Maltose ABC transporter permease n=1 Tax=Tepiditoga spiralis TaxID=2108365 RepID=A0A7G1G5Y9_9BACT|nr:sugar ABC transporter permease [Tepiditoga spiralis]BBE30494.1 maltose ABC transporter permease [Tepiditoga spiralis]